MEFFRFNRDIPFMSWRRTGAFISITTFILAVFFIATKGLNLGIDFTGGTALEVSYSQTADIDKCPPHKECHHRCAPSEYG